MKSSWRERKSFKDSFGKNHNLSLTRVFGKTQKILNLRYRNKKSVVYTQGEALKLQEEYRSNGYITRVVALNKEDYLLYISEKPLKSIKV